MEERKSFHLKNTLCSVVRMRGCESGYRFQLNGRDRYYNLNHKMEAEAVGKSIGSAFHIPTVR